MTTATTTTSRAFDATGPVSAKIDIGARADIWVGATNEARVTVDVTPRDPSRALDVRAAETTTVSFIDGRLSVALKHWRRDSWFTDGGAVLVAVEVPIGSSIDLYSGMGTLSADGEFGSAALVTGMGDVRVGTTADIRIKSGSGDVTIDGATGSVDVNTASGTISVGESTGSGRIKNGNGETTVGAVAGALEIRSSNGNIAVDHVTGDLTARSANGSIRVTEATSGSVNGTTTIGAIRVGVMPGTAAWLDLGSKRGQVRNLLAASDTPSSTDDTLRVTARSDFGDIVLHRSTEDAR